MNEDSPQGDSPKIIIDEDWKSQVQAEKQAAEEKTSSEESSSEESAHAQFPEDPEMPPASFELLVSGLATEAMMALGQIPNPVTGEIKPRRNQAKYLIDMIEVLKDKTQDRLTEEESSAIGALLHQLRMAFLSLG